MITRIIILMCSLVAMIGCEDAFKSRSDRFPQIKNISLQRSTTRPDYPVQVTAGVVIGDELLVANEFGLFRSLNSGSDWSQVALPLSANILALRSSADGVQLVAVTEQGQILRSNNAGADWAVSDVWESLPGINLEELREYGADMIERAEIGPGRKSFLLVGYCEVFISHDDANSWLRVSGNKDLGHWDDEDRCPTDVIVDENFQPKYASVDITGRFLTSGEYVLEWTDGAWKERCSFDLTAHLVKSVTKCSEVEVIRDQTRLWYHSDTFDHHWAEPDNMDDAIFDAHRLPITNTDIMAVSHDVLQGEDGRVWYIDYRGVAVTSDNGKSWTTLIGGITGTEESATLENGSRVALSQGYLYGSSSGKMWERLTPTVDAYKFLATNNSALLINQQGVSRLSNLKAKPTVVLPEPAVSYLDIWNDSIWAYGDEVLARSIDDGESWLSVNHSLDGDEWHCANQCVFIEYNGNVWQSKIVEDELEIQKISALPVEMSDSSYAGDQWSNSDRSVIAVIVELHDDNRLLVVSFDSGHTWHKGPKMWSYETYVAISNSRTVIAVDDGRIFRITGDELNFDEQPSRIPADIFGVCSGEGDTILIDAYGYHPDSSDYERGLLIYSTDDGITWWTMLDESSGCTE